MPVDPLSLLCGAALPVRVLESSNDSGWTSTLVEHHRVLDSGDPFDTLPTPDHTVVVMTRGEQHLQSYRNGTWRSAVYRPGTVGLTPGGVTNRLRRSVNRDAGAAHKVNIYIPRSVVAEATDLFGGETSISDSPPGSLGHLDEAVRQIALSLIRAFRAGAPDAYGESAVHWLALHLSAFARGARGQSEAPRRVTLEDRRLRKALDCVSDRFGEPLSIAEVAAEAGISKFHFSRLFRLAMGMSPYQWLLNTRLDAAKSMLEGTDLPVAEVASRCGFENANYFSTTFTRRFGFSPRVARLG